MTAPTMATRQRPVELRDQERLGTNRKRAVDHPVGRVSRRIVGEHRAPELHELQAVRLAERSNGDLCVCRHDKLVAQRRASSVSRRPAPHDHDGTVRLITLATAASDGDRQRALALLRRHGWNATSFQILEPGFLYWFDDHEAHEAEACVAYLDTGRAWVAAGAPIAGPERAPEVALRFVAAAAAHRRRACFFGTEDWFATAAPFAAMRIGEQADWDPVAWDETLRGTRSLREQIRRSRAKGVTVRPSTPTSSPSPAGELRASVDRLIARWEAAHPMPPMGFLVQMHLHTELAERRFFAATQGETLVGFLSMVPVFARGGWFVEDSRPVARGAQRHRRAAGRRGDAHRRRRREPLSHARPGTAGGRGRSLAARAPPHRAVRSTISVASRPSRPSSARGAGRRSSSLTRAGSSESPRSTTRWRRSRAAACSASVCRRCCDVRRS